MRILRVAQKLYPDVKGGGTYHVHAMSRDQAAMGHDVTVLTVDRETSQPCQEERAGYRIVRRPPTIDLLGNDISAGVSRYLCRADEFDVIHAHSHIYFSTVLAAVETRLADAPLAITNHGLQSQTAQEDVFEVYLRTVGRFVLNSADTVLSYTDEGRAQLVEYGVSSPVAVVHNGVDLERFAQDGPESDRVAGDPAVLFVGRLVDGKRPLDAVKAIAQFRERRPDATLTICGSGAKSAAVDEAATTLGIVDAVRQLGQVPYDMMPNLYRAADVLLLPSRTEGFPRAVIEALGCGTPVVTSDLDQLHSIVEGVGATAPVGDIAGFVSALDSVVDGTARDPREAVSATYDWADTVAKTTAVLQRLADGEASESDDVQRDSTTSFRELL